jgi:hypothetical protein
MDKIPKKRMGRPPIENPACEWLPGIRVTPEENERFRAAADAAGLPFSTWVRRTLAKAAKPKRRKATWTHAPARGPSVRP